jgi:hypothetical protein
MDTLIVFAVAMGLLIACGFGAMVWGERRLIRATGKHRSG